MDTLGWIVAAVLAMALLVLALRRGGRTADRILDEELGSPACRQAAEALRQLADGIAADGSEWLPADDLVRSLRETADRVGGAR